MASSKNHIFHLPEVTCIPAYEFAGFLGDFTFKSFDKLLAIDKFAFGAKDDTLRNLYDQYTQEVDLSKSVDLVKVDKMAFTHFNADFQQITTAINTTTGQKRYGSGGCMDADFRVPPLCFTFENECSLACCRDQCRFLGNDCSGFTFGEGVCSVHGKNLRADLDFLDTAKLINPGLKLVQCHVADQGSDLIKYVRDPWFVGGSHADYECYTKVNPQKTYEIMCPPMSTMGGTGILNIWFDVFVVGSSFTCTNPTTTSTIATTSKTQDCDILPGSINGYLHPKGCRGAVWKDGKGSNQYCTNSYNDAKYAWYEECCNWQALISECCPKTGNCNELVTNPPITTTTTVVYDCDDLPESPAGAEHPHGCAGAVWADSGVFNNAMCINHINTVNTVPTPWYEACCRWTNNECEPLITTTSTTTTTTTTTSTTTTVLNLITTTSPIPSITTMPSITTITSITTAPVDRSLSWFKNADANKDAKLSFLESGMKQNDFEFLDTDNDKFLSAEELSLELGLVQEQSNQWGLWIAVSVAISLVGDVVMWVIDNRPSKPNLYSLLF